MINELSEKLLRQFEIKLKKVILEAASPIDRLTSSLHLIQDTSKNLKDLVEANSFGTPQEEIIFFKRIKPMLYSFKIFEIDLYQFSLKIPIGDDQDIMAYYREELQEIQRFFKLNVFHYKYYLLGLSDLDNLYFLRNAVVPVGLIHEMPEQDANFSSSHDYLFAKFLAYERLQMHILNEIKVLNNLVLPGASSNSDESERLKWTGEAINLVEVAYGIWLTGQLNNGNASITEIISWFEDKLQIKIGRAYRRWTEISNRKRISSTKYIDTIRDSIHKRIDDEYALKATSKKSESPRS